MADEEITKIQRDDHDTLIRVETKLQSLTDEIRNANSSVSRVTADHEARIRSLENIIEVNRGTQENSNNSRRTMLEVAGAIAAIVTAVATYLLARHP